MKKEKVPFSVTFTSLVGIGSEEYPIGFGNYCGIGKYYCVNMWAENIKEFRRRNPEITEVEVAVFGIFAVVIDEKIPEEWRSSFCITGYGMTGSTTGNNLKELYEFCNQSLENKFCGCEDMEKEGPHILERGNAIGFKCTRCERIWGDWK